MWDRWLGRNTDLKTLGEQMKQFFEKKNFSSLVEEKSESEFRVIAVQKRKSSDFKALLRANITICGEPNDFKVEFIGNSTSGISTKLGLLATLLGGGIFVLRELKSSEEAEKLENEFWRFIEEAIDYSSGAIEKE